MGGGTHRGVPGWCRGEGFPRGIREVVGRCRPIDKAGRLCTRCSRTGTPRISSRWTTPSVSCWLNAQKTFPKSRSWPRPRGSPWTRTSNPLRAGGVSANEVDRVSPHHGPLPQGGGPSSARGVPPAGARACSTHRGEPGVSGGWASPVAYGHT